MSDKITIAQALRRIKKLKGTIAENTVRATQGVTYVSTKIPAFRYADAVTAISAARAEMIDLETRVALANAKKTIVSPLGVKITLTYAIRLLQELKGEIAFLRCLSLRNEVVREREQNWDDEQLKRVIRVTEVIYVSDLSEQDRDLKIKSCQDSFEELNNLVEEANHSVLV